MAGENGGIEGPARGEQDRAPAGRRDVRTPLGTMVIVLVYALGTVILWSYMYYHTLRYGGGLGGH
ncbi:MAG: hypothetical protein H0Z37_03625 [Firmicutes bacterium]|nr:hypothetical protein [Bacillota bacterium]